MATTTATTTIYDHEDLAARFRAAQDAYGRSQDLAGDRAAYNAELDAITAELALRNDPIERLAAELLPGEERSEALFSTLVAVAERYVDSLGPADAKHRVETALAGLAENLDIVFGLPA